MKLLKKMLAFFAKNFVFLVGIILIFVFGFLYSYIRPQGYLLNAVFFVIVLGWIIFMIRYFWELMEKDNK